MLHEPRFQRCELRRRFRGVPVVDGGAGVVSYKLFGHAALVGLKIGDEAASDLLSRRRRLARRPRGPRAVGLRRGQLFVGRGAIDGLEHDCAGEPPFVRPRAPPPPPPEE